MITKEKKAELIEQYGRQPGDTGSPEVQIAILTERIRELTEHLKTHNSKNISNQKKSPISEHRKNCHHNENPKKDNPQPVIPKKKEIKVDDNLGLEKCEYCANVVEDLKEHLENCEVKKMIEIENAKYYSDLERRKKKMMI